MTSDKSAVSRMVYMKTVHELTKEARSAQRLVSTLLTVSFASILFNLFLFAALLVEWLR